MKSLMKIHRSLGLSMCVLLLMTNLAYSQSETENKKSVEIQKRKDSIVKPKGHVLTYYGLRKLEHDPQVSEEEKLREWEEFIVRARSNITYAKKAVERWKKAARQRVLENVRNDDQDKSLAPATKITRWKRIIKLYPRSQEARLAKKRVTYWQNAETKLLVESANRVEKQSASKVERIQAWLKVTKWTKSGPEQRAAQKRIKVLQQQLFQEAKDLDRIRRVDAATKLAGWRDVLAGAPTSSQKKLALKRISNLEKK